MEEKFFVIMKPRWVFGIGYWKVTYNELGCEITGWCRNVIFGFLHIQICRLFISESDGKTI